jgi:multidrug resistance efflux pump
MRAAATTAVVVGTAGAVSGHQQKKANAAAQDQAAQEAAYETQAQVAELQAQLNAQQAAPAAPEIPTEELEKLGQLHASGVLSDEEFAAAKAKLLGI